MKKLLSIATIALLALSTATAQSELEGYLVSKSEPNGTLYFLKPQQILQDDKGRKLQHDITIKKGADNSAIINITYITPTPQKARAISIKSRKISVVSHNIEQVYIEPAKKGWAHRYSIKTTPEKIREIYSVTNPPIVTVITDQSAVLQYTKIHKAWMKYAPIGEQIMQLIELNN